MHPSPCRFVGAAFIVAVAAAGCGSTAPPTSTSPIASVPSVPPVASVAPSIAAPSVAASAVTSAPVEPRAIGPFEIPFAEGRSVYYVAPSSRDQPQRLLANLHGMCNPPAYACGYWSHAASEAGFLVCPTGNSKCGHAMFDAPTWTESYAKMDEDLERSIAAVDGANPGEISRTGAILTGFSRGGFAAPEIAKLHPGRWPLLLINEADVAVSVASLRASGVVAVAFVAGERSESIAGERATTARLARAGFPAKLWVMPGAGHYYSANIDDIMRDAIEWLAAQPLNR
jgi:pimeloyl-ACP methyl ester carboxylesterase